MAEVLGAIASGMSAVSLATQVAESFQKFSGPGAMSQWLKQYGEAQISNLSILEVQELLYRRLMAPHWNNRSVNIRQIVSEGKINGEIARDFSEDTNAIYPNLLFQASIWWSRYKKDRRWCRIIGV